MTGAWTLISQGKVTSRPKV